MLLHISSAQTSFKSAGLDLQLSGEKKFKETIVAALGKEGFHIDPKNILTVPVRKEVVFHTETIYDSSL